MWGRVNWEEGSEANTEEREKGGIKKSEDVWKSHINISSYIPLPVLTC